MTHYLVRTHGVQAVAPQLEFFADDDNGKLTATEHLTAYLQHLILLNHYAGTGPLIRAFWRWTEDDSREELSLIFLRTHYEGEVYDDYYQVIVKDTLEDVARFSVRFS